MPVLSFKFIYKGSALSRFKFVCHKSILSVGECTKLKRKLGKITELKKRLGKIGSGPHYATVRGGGKGVPFYRAR
jgi:hypothetical protein